MYTRKEFRSINRCLRIYVTLDKIKDAENLTRKEIVGPLIDSVISIENLQIDLLGLKKYIQQIAKYLERRAQATFRYYVTFR